VKNRGKRSTFEETYLPVIPAEMRSSFRITGGAVISVENVI
jgi:hypothetical protein